MGVIVATVLVHGNEAGALEVLRLIAAQDRLPDAVVVVDNGSAAPLDLLTSAGRSVRLVRADGNLGVGGGHNLGIRTALDDCGADHVWVLEHDTFPDPGCLAQLEGLALRHPAGVIVPDATRNNYERRWIVGDHDGEATTRFTFNGVLIAREVVDQVGPVNEVYFVGQEDWDYSQRVFAAAIPITRCSTAVVLHANKGDGRFPGFVSPTRLYYSARNLLALNPTSSQFSAVRSWFGTMVKCVRQLVRFGRGRRHASAYWWAHRDGRRGNMGQQSHRFMRD